MTTQQLAKPFGNGETQSFKLTEVGPVAKQYKTAVRQQRVQGIFGYVPRIMVSSDSRHARLIELGLDTLAEAEKRATPIEFARMLYPELTNENTEEWSLDTWSKFLPTKSSLQEFAYDSIPDQSLSDIEEARRMGVFDRIEIWSPEGNDLKSKIDAHKAQRAIQREILAQSRDPLAVGVIQDHTGKELLFAITRWGESLMPFEMIKQYVDDVERGFNRYLARVKTLDIMKGVGAVLAILAVLAVIVTLIVSLIMMLGVGSFVIMALVFVVCVGIGLALSTM